MNKEIASKKKKTTVGNLPTAEARILHWAYYVLSSEEREPAATNLRQGAERSLLRRWTSPSDHFSWEEESQEREPTKPEVRGEAKRLQRSAKSMNKERLPPRRREAERLKSKTWGLVFSVVIIKTLTSQRKSCKDYQGMKESFGRR